MSKEWVYVVESCETQGAACPHEVSQVVAVIGEQEKVKPFCEQYESDNEGARCEVSEFEVQ